MMSSEHRRPLAAFVLLTFVCGFLIVSTMRDNARDLLQRADRTLVADPSFTPSPKATEPSDPERVVDLEGRTNPAPAAPSRDRSRDAKAGPTPVAVPTAAVGSGTAPNPGSSSAAGGQSSDQTSSGPGKTDGSDDGVRHVRKHRHGHKHPTRPPVVDVLDQVPGSADWIPRGHSSAGKHQGRGHHHQARHHGRGHHKARHHGRHESREDENGHSD